jgi:SAM-dependent methyltransferase
MSDPRDDRDPDDPWDWMVPEDAARFGDVIRDRAEQKRWSQAVFLGGLPYMWRKAAVPRQLIFDRLELTEGDRLLIVGEAVEGCGFGDEARSIVGPDGAVDIVEIMDAARDAYLGGVKGRGGQLATWRFDYANNIPDGQYDCVAVIQAVQHADDWREAGAQFLRIMKPGRRIVLAEITFGPNLAFAAQMDVHLDYLLTKIFRRIGWQFADFPYYSPEALAAAFAGLVTDPQTFCWKGIEMFWGRKG